MLNVLSWDKALELLFMYVLRMFWDETRDYLLIVESN